MASSVDSIVIGRAVCRSFPSLTPIFRPRCLSTLISSSAVRPCPAISVRHASSFLNACTVTFPRKLYDVPTKEFPEDSPFEIVDNPGDLSVKVMLKREFEGENIEISVIMEDSEDDAALKIWRGESGGAQTYMDQTLSLVVTISRGDGTELEFGCLMDSEYFDIESMTMKRHGEVDNEEEAHGWPHFMTLHWDLQIALLKYLGARGINPSLHRFLIYSLLGKDDIAYVIWAKNLAEFVAKGRVTGES